MGPLVMWDRAVLKEGVGILLSGRNSGSCWWVCPVWDAMVVRGRKKIVNYPLISIFFVQLQMELVRNNLCQH